MTLTHIPEVDHLFAVSAFEKDVYKFIYGTFNGITNNGQNYDPVIDDEKIYDLVKYEYGISIEDAHNIYRKVENAVADFLLS
ncbi:hypothetical protein [Jeotgalibacillus malaysiensis]|uniref:hypothetical protein n=1 Tax=Jeotgalibacillus malaysiensis TaxID=1508404 RepID=UPI00384C37D5